MTEDEMTRLLSTSRLVLNVARAKRIRIRGLCKNETVEKTSPQFWRQILRRIVSNRFPTLRAHVLVFPR